MVVIKGTNSLEFHPQGDRFTYHTTDDPAAEPVALKNVLDFCHKLGDAFKNIIANVKADKTWWTQQLGMDGDAQGIVAIEEIRTKANLMLKNATIQRTKLAAIKNGFPAGVVFYGSMDPFPLADATPNGAGAQELMSFSVEVNEAATREYYTTPDGVLHCSGKLPLSMNGKPLLLTDGDFADGAIEVVYSVDFIIPKLP
jgi:hypothetical protein